MRLLLERWRKFINEEKKKIESREEMEAIIRAEPNQEMNIDAPRGSKKRFGGKVRKELIFDYGEWPQYINPADKMGWDFIIVPSADRNTPNLLPVGNVVYAKEYKKKAGNDKIIIAPNGVATEADKETINTFFGEMEGRFVAPEWYS